MVEPLARQSLLASLLLLAAAAPALAQDRLDLSGTWTLKPTPNSPGSVTFSGRARGPEGDTYAMAVTLPDGTSRGLRATFDGRTLSTVPADGGTGAAAAPGPSVGLVSVIDAGTASGTTSAPAATATPPPPSPEGRYTLTITPATATRPVTHSFRATGPVHPAGGTPVERFGRLEVPKAIETLELTGITFTSDHGVLCEYETDWRAGGARIPEPEWTTAKAHPISHTMDTAITVRVEVQVGPADAAPARVTLVGDGPGAVDFRQEVELKPGENTLELTSTGALPRRVQELDLAVTWSVEGATATVRPASTTTPVFVTFGAPAASGNAPGFTTKRMRKAIQAVGAVGDLEPHAIVRTIISKWGHYNLRVAFHNAWELADDKIDPTTGGLVGADCQTIVRFTRDVIQQVGVPGQADYVVIYAHCKDPAKGLESLNARNYMTNPRQMHNDHFDRKWNRGSWYAVLVDGGGGRNNYEAALKFSYDGTQKYYPGGVNAVMDDPDQIIRVFTTMSWVSGKDIKGTIHAYR